MVTLTRALVRHLRQSQKSLLYPSYTSVKDGECCGKQLECMGKGRVPSHSRVHASDHMIPTPHCTSAVYRHPIPIESRVPIDNPTQTPPRTMTSTATTRPAPLPQPHHYIRFAISPPLGSADALEIRRLLQEALAQSFGTTLSHVYLDVLSVTPSGDECVVCANGPR